MATPNSESYKNERPSSSLIPSDSKEAASSSSVPSGSAPNPFSDLPDHIMLELVKEMASMNDLINFIAVNKRTKQLIQNENFGRAIKSLCFDDFGGRRLVCQGLMDFEANCTGINPKKRNRRHIESHPLETAIVKGIEVPERVQAMCLHSEYLKDFNLPNIPAFSAYYILPNGEMGQTLVESGDLRSDKKQRKREAWFGGLVAPPREYRFSSLSSDGNFFCAKTINGQLMVYGWEANGERKYRDRKWVMIPHFSSPDGLAQSSLGPSRVAYICVDWERVIIILENHAVFCFGDIDWMRKFHNSIPSSGLVELTNSNMFRQPRFVEVLSGLVPQEAGQFGLFGKHHIVKYNKGARFFLSAEGVMFMETWILTRGVGNSFLTPVDPNLFFFGEKLVEAMFSDGKMLALTENGRIMICEFDPREHTVPEIFEWLTEPIIVRQLPFPTKQLKKLCLTSNFLYALTTSGKLHSVLLRKRDNFTQELEQGMARYGHYQLQIRGKGKIKRPGVRGRFGGRGRRGGFRARGRRGRRGMVHHVGRGNAFARGRGNVQPVHVGGGGGRGGGAAGVHGMNERRQRHPPPPPKPLQLVETGVVRMKDEHSHRYIITWMERVFDKIFFLCE
ncbi:uncharacterized protein MONOS_1818 [Monocercomonoides exilis]|uniref:uncharacterized protein n=1 Tax=Monocercomonoides exilis TaxID=2049356 RepID=UPI00355A3D1D|nr:hypothetical protein MONOS_1818 [Monocercomonoides exilis]|eukprot:MONOS_1818.1-p1 / transcript=MONOS_1818.1 / gene=MONOS_1818 / organism=Monocercomonoides_exilis_PA203 / gene_product=unspecified product / transcript_product=unspecified product / location=Mono_scaffold00034:92921-95033(+) / protein_length=618 / sequence_SO=supercontig / SO=protein_coding / is_pseudo=false